MTRTQYNRFKQAIDEFAVWAITYDHLSSFVDFCGLAKIAARDIERYVVEDPPKEPYFAETVLSSQNGQVFEQSTGSEL